mgnify:CR=1 FL=1
MKRAPIPIIFSSILLVTSCAVLDRDVRDRDACSEINSLGSAPGQIEQIREKALPKASARLGRSLHQYVRLATQLSEGSVQSTPGTQARSERLRGEIMSRCGALGASDITAEQPESPTDAASGLGNSPSLAPNESSSSTDLEELLNTLKIAPENRTGYDRELFTHWIDIDGNGCNTRVEVLISESLPGLELLDNCELVGGEWVSVYDGATTANPSQFDIDHLVPLAEAWDSGASEWEPERREAFANALESPDALIAVSASSNRSKGDKDPAEWLPPDESFWCEYVSSWITIKSEWGLTVDQDEKSAMLRVIQDCD